MLARLGGVVALTLPLLASCEVPGAVSAGAKSTQGDAEWVEHYPFCGSFLKRGDLEDELLRLVDMKQVVGSNVETVVVTGLAEVFDNATLDKGKTMVGVEILKLKEWRNESRAYVVDSYGAAENQIITFIAPGLQLREHRLSNMIMEFEIDPSQKNGKKVVRHQVVADGNWECNGKNLATLDQKTGATPSSEPRVQWGKIKSTEDVQDLLDRPGVVDPATPTVIYFDLFEAKMRPHLSTVASHLNQKHANPADSPEGDAPLFMSMISSQSRPYVWENRNGSKDFGEYTTTILNLDPELPIVSRDMELLMDRFIDAVGASSRQDPPRQLDIVLSISEASAMVVGGSFQERLQGRVQKEIQKQRLPANFQISLVFLVQPSADTDVGTPSQKKRFEERLDRAIPQGATEHVSTRLPLWVFHK